MKHTAPVGVFDSGVGGLSVLREMRLRLPAEDFIYIADSGHVPYGNKTADAIIERARVLSRYLIGRGCKALVIACNTATAAAAAKLREDFPQLPVIGMEPAVKPAAAATRNRIVGVLATVGTLRSARFAALLERFGREVSVITQPAPGLVEQVEAGRLDTRETRELIAVFTRPLIEAGADTIVLGCTHYPFLKSLIAAAVGPNVALIDTGAAVARELERRLAEAHRLRPGRRDGTEEYFTTGDLLAAQAAFAALWGPEAVVRELPDGESPPKAAWP